MYCILGMPGDQHGPEHGGVQAHELRADRPAMLRRDTGLLHHHITGVLRVQARILP